MSASPKHTPGNESPPPSRPAFWIILILTPLLLLGGAELILRWFDYGGTLDLVVRTKVLGKEWYTLNRSVARRYFLQQGVALPEPADDLFEINKGRNTKRIFMLGESTMQGFPFDYNATPSRLMQDRLRQLLPGYNIEVVNAGLSAVNSYTILDFAKELLEYSPDAFVVYAGHNEFYGAMGVGSTEYLGRWRAPIDLYVKLLRSRLFLLIRDGIVAARNLVKHPGARPGSDLMEAMVREQEIRYRSDEYERALGNFESNLRSLLSASAARQVPVVLCTLTSNIRDQRPFVPLFRESLGDSLRKLWDENEARGEEAMRRGSPSAALPDLLRAVSIDSTQAMSHYDLGRCLDTLGRFAEAKDEYRKARDYDGLRFRASTETNGLIRSLCREGTAILADADTSFDAHSPGGIVGDNLMMEHLHPNFEGYFLLAKVMAQALAGRGVPAPKSEWHWERDLTDERYKELSGVTDFELEAAKCRTAALTNRWPFTSRPDPDREYRADTRLRQLAQQYVRKQIAWSDAHYAAADWYRSNGGNAKAVGEYYAVSKVLPGYYYPVMLTGDAYRAMKNDSLAEETYRRALALQESPFVHAHLGMLYFDRGNMPKSITEFEAVFTRQAEGPEKVDPKAEAVAYFFLGVSYGRVGNLGKARENLLAALRLDPQNEDAKRILSQIQ
jgi:tetratricopeptide (TPR) repeat protein